MISCELRAILETRFDIGTIAAIQPLEGGYWNSMLKLQCDKGIFVLRISHPTTIPESVAYEHDLMRFMSARLPQVPAPLAARDGTTFFSFDGRVLSLFPFIAGQIADCGREPVRRAAAEILAQLHRAAVDYPTTASRPGHTRLRDLNWDRNRLWDWEQVDAFLSGDKELSQRVANRLQEEELSTVSTIVSRWSEITRERVSFQQWVARLAASHRRLLLAPMQGDFYGGNLLFEGDQVTAVLDWDECGPEWLCYELGRATWEFCKSKGSHSLNRSWALGFLQVYQNAGGPVPPGSFDLVIPFMRCVRVQEVLFALGEALRGEPWDPGYTLHNLISLQNLKHVQLFA